MNLFIFLALSFAAILLIGRLIEKIRVPWIFSALLLGAIFSGISWIKPLTNSRDFVFLAELGMYFLLFMVGFEINLSQVKKMSGLILKGTFLIIFLEAIFGGLFIHYFFHYSFVISFLVSLSFATVGEAILVPILDEFKIMKTKLGQSIIGIGSLDDIIEVAILMVVAFMVSSSQTSWQNVVIIISSLVALFAFTYILTRFKNEGKRFAYLSIDTLLLLSLAVLFIFLGIGEYGHAAALGALLAGLGLKSFLPVGRLQQLEKEIKAVCYGFFAPIFFLWVGSSIDMNTLVTLPLVILAIVIISNTAKLFGSWLIGRKTLGNKQSILLGVGLSVRFSTSIVIIQILYQNDFIDETLYSVIIASSIIFTFIIPVIFSNLLLRWKVVKKGI